MKTRVGHAKSGINPGYKGNNHQQTSLFSRADLYCWHIWETNEFDIFFTLIRIGYGK